MITEQQHIQRVRDHNLRIKCMPCTYPEERKALSKKTVRTCNECGPQVVHYGKCSQCGKCIYCNTLRLKGGSTQWQ